MSFSYSAAGTKDETLASLRAAHDGAPDGLGRDIAAALIGALETGPGSYPDGTPARYEVSAYGHSSPDSLASCSVSVRTVLPG